MVHPMIAERKSTGIFLDSHSLKRPDRKPDDKSEGLHEGALLKKLEGKGSDFNLRKGLVRHLPEHS